MPLARGTRIGPYEIGDQIGAGGMGEVYRAVDSNLNRAVAIKVLPESLAHDAERLARFEREAKTLASLSHPNIAQVFGLEKTRLDGGRQTLSLVMELIDGPTLADRIAAGPLPLDEALAIATQIADALENAHEHAIIHRDLKPANVKARTDGVVKILDFGLAKALMPAAAGSESGSASLAHSPTVTSPATQAGVILGTAAYMSPEQAKGRVVDRRTDIWAFGCVLFEMLTGARAFDGSDVSEMMVSILRDEPDWPALPATTPPHVRSLLRRCLQKDARKRLPHIGVARLELAEPSTAMEPPAAIAEPPARVRRTTMIGVAAALIVLAIGTASVTMWPRRPAIPAAPLRLRAEVGTDRPVLLTSSVAMAPDGRTIAFAARFAGDDVATPNLYARSLDRLDAQMLPGTEGAQAPFFSPDGQWIGFFDEGVLKKISILGGGAITISEARSQRGGSWGDDNSIVFAATDGIMRVSAAGGSAAVIVKPEGPPPQWPQLLPGSRSVLYMTAINSDPEAGAIMAKTLPDGPPRTLLKGGRFPRYLPSGHLTFFRNRSLHAVPFDPVTLETRGEAVPVVEGIAQTTLVGTPIVSVSANGTMAYQPDADGVSRQTPVVWLTKTGTPGPLRTTPASWAFPRFSPDGRRLAMMIFDGRQTDIWVYDWQRDILTRVTSDPAGDAAPVWTPDGTGLVFGSSRNGTVANLYWQRADGTGPARRLTEAPIAQLPDAFDPGGRRLIFHEGDPATARQSLGVLHVEGDGAGGLKASAPPAVLIGGSFLKANARVSPDGRWLSYAAYDSGVFEIYVQPLDGTGGRVQVSSGGGGLAIWSRVKNELYYVGGTEGTMMAVPFSIEGNAFVPERPRPWSETRFSSLPPFSLYGPGVDLHPDGQRFAVTPVASANSDAATRAGQIVLVFNLFDELRRLAPLR
jgi:Tol biopolymer transport system component